MTKQEPMEQKYTVTLKQVLGDDLCPYYELRNPKGITLMVTPFRDLVYQIRDALNFVLLRDEIMTAVRDVHKVCQGFGGKGADKYTALLAKLEALDGK